MDKSLIAGAAVLALYITVFIAGGYGWVMNIITLAHMDSILTGLGALRAVGVIVAPLGAVLGYV
ncbi:hypothetical protein [Herbaspirillum huttiense]|uniref:hypothetical protein n=1 Tax=Herbaspirillum huttiense TaxID=863372 RepID=UPI002E76BA29|nr:hypothetical protein [Herbaspirillum huttiense]MEE1636383.1 hypothetical protein [Herbaspirillum huttiense NC40101]